VIDAVNFTVPYNDEETEEEFGNIPERLNP